MRRFRPGPGSHAALVFAASLALALPAVSGPVAFDDSWQQQRFSLFSTNVYGFDGQEMTLASDGAVSLAYRQVPRADWGARSARWSWAVTRSVPPSDLELRGGDDRNVALYFVFMPQAEAQALGLKANIRDLLRDDNARVLVYVWGGQHMRGEILASPYLGARGKTVVLRGAGTGGFDESVDLGADFTRAFGGAAPALVGLAVSADSDDTDTSIRASISGLRLE